MTIYKQNKLNTERLQEIKVEEPLKWIAEYQPKVIQRLSKVSEAEIENMKRKLSKASMELKYSADDYEYLARVERQKVDQAYFISGYIQPNENGTLKRNNDSLVRRDLICMDYDELSITHEAFNSLLENVLKEYSFVTYPTIKSTDVHPRMRVIIKPNRPLLKYE